MNWLNRLRGRLAVDRDLSEEIAQHLDERVDELMSGGLSRHDANDQARREFGNPTLVGERGRDVWRFTVVEDLWADLHYATRQLRRSPAFALAAIATLALGIGANTAVFSVIDAILLRELPVQNPSELVVFDWLRTQDSMVAGYSGYGRPGSGAGVGIRTSFSVLTFEQFRDQAATLSQVFAFSPARVNVVTDGHAETASGLLVSGDYFSGLGVNAHLGRTISASDESRNADVAVISHRYWQRRFSGDPNVVGKTIEVNRAEVVIVGVAPQGFHGVRMTESSDLTLPLAMASRLSETGKGPPISLWWVQMMGRLKPGVTRDQALAELQASFAETVRESWAARSPDTPNPTRAGMPQLRVLPGAQGPDGPRIDARQTLMVVFAVVAATLLIGCVNLANLLLVRASARLREISVRLALGASRWRVVRQLLTESVLLAFAGATAGILLAWWGKDFMEWVPASQELPIVEARIGPRTLAFTVGLSALTALAFGMWPAVRATRCDLGSALKVSAQRGGLAHGILSKTLLVAQVAISLVLLAGAGLLVRTLYNFSQVDIGFNADNLLLFRINPAVQGEPASRVFDRYERLMSSIEAVPGVESVTLSIMPVIARSEWEESVRTDGASEPQDVFIQIVRWNFLETMGMPLVAGRSLSAADTGVRSRVAIVNETMARQLFGEPYPVGRSFHFVNGSDRNVPIQVVGVARDANYASLSQRAPPTLFMPYTQLPPGGMTVEVRTAFEPTALIPAVREAVRRIDAGLPLIDMKTQRQQIAETIGVQRSIALLTAVSGVVALLLASIGLYGVVSYEATRRTTEIGIRMALGARRSDVLGLVVRRTLIVVMIGGATGVALAPVASLLIEALLFGVRRTDPLTMASVLVLLMTVAVFAAYVPARRASRLDPAHALRHD